MLRIDSKLSLLALRRMIATAPSLATCSSSPVSQTLLSVRSRKLTYIYKETLLLKPGKQTGIHDSPPPALMPSASKSMLKSRCRSPGCKECFFGRTTLTRRPPATMRPYSRSSTRAFSKVLLIIWGCTLRIFNDSSDESNVDGEPRVKLSASDDKRTSVP